MKWWMWLLVLVVVAVAAWWWWSTTLRPGRDADARARRDGGPGDRPPAPPAAPAAAEEFAAPTPSDPLTAETGPGEGVATSSDLDDVQGFRAPRVTAGSDKEEHEGLTLSRGGRPDADAALVADEEHAIVSDETAPADVVPADDAEGDDSGGAGEPVNER